MFVLIVSRGYPNPTSPLRGIFEFDQAKALQQAGIKVVMLSLDFRSVRRHRKWGKSVFFVDGIQIMNVSIPIGNVPAQLFIAIGKRVVKHISSDLYNRFGKPDIIHAHFSDIAAVAYPLKKLFNAPLIVTEHSSKLNNNVIDLKTRYYSQLAYRNADKIISVSKALSKKLFLHFKVESFVIPNIVDLQTFNYQPIKKKHFTFISTGNLTKHKGFDILINAFSNLQIHDLQLIIIGDGPEKKSLQHLIDGLKLSDRVQLLGRKERFEINELYANSQVFVLASHGETFGVAFIEAMAAGLPVIATRCGGPEDFVDSQNGILIDVNDSKQLADALLAMKTNIHLYNRDAIAIASRESFSAEIIAGKLIKLYTEVINTKND